MELKAVLFDWGDTIMKVFPGSSGPMAGWPEVAIVEGADMVLHDLGKDYSLALVTNATDSSSDQVADALARVGLEGAFDHIFTAMEIGHRKPEEAFYRTALDRIGIKSRNAVMVGDDFEKDVIGARAAGLMTVWFNPTEEDLPEDHEVHADAIIGRLIELPGVLSDLSKGMKREVV